MSDNQKCLICGREALRNIYRIFPSKANILKMGNMKRFIMLVVLIILLLCGCASTAQISNSVDNEERLSKTEKQNQDISSENTEKNQGLTINDLKFINDRTLPGDILDHLGQPDEVEGLETNYIIYTYVLSDGSYFRYSYGYHTKGNTSYIVYNDLIIVLGEDNNTFENSQASKKQVKFLVDGNE